MIYNKYMPFSLLPSTDPFFFFFWLFCFVFERTTPSMFYFYKKGIFSERHTKKRVVIAQETRQVGGRLRSCWGQRGLGQNGEKYWWVLSGGGYRKEKKKKKLQLDQHCCRSWVGLTVTLMPTIAGVPVPTGVRATD